MRAQSADEPSSLLALNELCKIYRPALFHFLRAEGWKWDLAEEMTQAFFAYAIETELFRKADQSRGKLRTLLLTSLRNFSAGEYRKANAVRRGGLLERVDVEVEALPDSRETEARFDYYWSVNLLDRTMQRLKEEYEARDRGALFEILQPMLSGIERGKSLPEAAARLGISENALRVARRRLKKRFQAVIREEVAETTALSEDEIEIELRHMTQALSQGPP